MNDIVSVIVPIYNVEKYLKKCIDSIIKQTYNKIEIILVDDGSTDQCSSICDNYEKKDNRIKVIHKENGGLSDARNTGLNFAKGKYVVFIDSDDYINEKYIELLYNSIKRNNTLIAQCGIIIVNDNLETIKKLGYNKDEINTVKKMMLDMSNEHGLENVVVWDKMYDIKLLKNIRFPKGKLHEDEFFTYKVLYNAQMISVIKDQLYYYRQNENSIMGKKYNLKRLEVIDALEERIAFFKNKNEEELYNYSIVNFLKIVKDCYCNVKKYYSSEKELLKELKIKYRTLYKELIKMKNISLINKIKKAFFYIMPNVYYKIYFKD